MKAKMHALESDSKHREPTDRLSKVYLLGDEPIQRIQPVKQPTTRPFSDVRSCPKSMVEATSQAGAS